MRPDCGGYPVFSGSCLISNSEGEALYLYVGTCLLQTCHFYRFSEYPARISACVSAASGGLNLNIP